MAWVSNSKPPVLPTDWDKLMNQAVAARQMVQIYDDHLEAVDGLDVINYSSTSGLHTHAAPSHNHSIGTFANSHYTITPTPDLDPYLTISYDGKVTLSKSVEESAKLFWDYVKKTAPQGYSIG